MASNRWGGGAARAGSAAVPALIARCADPDAEAERFALDPPVAPAPGSPGPSALPARGPRPGPAGVLRRWGRSTSCCPGAGGRPARCPGVTIRCSRRPEGSRSEHGDHGTVSPVRTGAGDLTAQDSDLVAEYQDLRILGGIAPRQERQPAEHPDHKQVGKTDEHERRAYSSRSGPHARFWLGRRLARR